VRGRKSEVELVEDDAAPVELPEDRAAEELGEPPSRGRGVLRAWPLALLALVVAGAYLVDGARERAARAELEARLEGQPLFVRELSRRPEPLWSREDASIYVWPWVQEDTVVIARQTELGTEGNTRFLDLETGEPLWETRADGGATTTFCGFVPEDTELPEGAVLCVRYLVDESEGSVEGATYELRDLRSGELVLEHGWRAGGEFVYPWGEDFVVVDEGSSDVHVRLRGSEGEERWSVPLGDVEREIGGGALVQIDHSRAFVSVAGRAVVLERDGTVVLDVEAPELEEVGETWVNLEPLADGYFSLSTVSFAPSTADSERVTQVYAPDGTLAYEVSQDDAGWPAQLGLDDGSLGRVHAWSGGRTVLRDAASGAERWSTTWGAESFVMIADKKVVLASGGRVRVLDEEGVELWSEVGSEPVASDGKVLTILENVGEVARLRAFELGSGSELWALELGSAEARPTATGGHLFLHDSGTFSLLR